MISFLPAASKRIAKIMRANKTKPLAVKVDGKRLSPAYAVNGVVLIGGSFTLTEAEALALKISGKPPIPDSFDEP